MISGRARSSFNELLKQAVRENLVAPGEVCGFQEIGGVEAAAEKEVVVLTISSYLFRLITFFHFTRDRASREHFARLVRRSVQDLDDQSFYDAVSEFGNLCSGSLNRDLGVFFPHVGMSTPNILEHGCLSYLESLSPGHMAHFAIALDSRASFKASICVCDYGDLDFHFEAKTAAESTGELELF